jgi:hypothetical protein
LDDADLRRWRDALDTIRTIHGNQVAVERTADAS